MVFDYRLCSLKIKPNPLINKLHLYAEISNKCFNNYRNNRVLTIGLINKHKVSIQPRQEHLLCILHLVDEVKHNLRTTDFKTTIYCSENFITHYNIDSQTEYYFTPVEPNPLENIVISASNDEFLNWIAKNKEFGLGLLFSHTSNFPLLFRQDDVFLGDINSFYGDNTNTIISFFNKLKVIHCSPWKQGVCTSKTSIVVVNDQKDEIWSSSSSNSDSEDDACFYNIDIKDCRNISSLSLTDITISQTIAKNIGVEDGEFVAISLHHKDENICETKLLKMKFMSQRVLRVRIGLSNSNSCISMTSYTWFNLVPNGLYLNAMSYVAEISKTSREWIYAREVHVSPIHNPMMKQSSSVSIDNIIMKAFEKPFICRVGDILTFNVSDNVGFYLKTELNLYKFTEIHFKVVGFASDENKSQGYLVDSKHTSLYQEKPVLSFIPSSNEKIQYPPGLDNYVNKLTRIILPYIHINDLQHPCTLMLCGESGSGKESIISSSCQQLGLQMLQVDCLNIVSDSPGAGERKLQVIFERAMKYRPFVLVLKRIESLVRSHHQSSNQEAGRMMEALHQCIKMSEPQYCDEQNVNFPLIVIATTEQMTNVTSGISSLFLHQIEIKQPSENERLKMLKIMSKALNISKKVNLERIAKNTAGFNFGGISELLRKTKAFNHARIIEKCAVGKKIRFCEEQLICMSGFEISNEDFQASLDSAQSEKSDTIGVPKIPTVKWEDIGGLEKVKQEILDTVQLPLDYPQLCAGNMNRSGLLLYGPPGTGKTLLAKCVASQCSLTFLSVKGPELINMYVGQSEENVRRVFQLARSAAPCIVFFDELDALAPNRGKSGDSGGVMDRIVSQLLAELDGVNSTEDSGKHVFVIAASNRPDLIDPSLLRPGRFDRLIYVGVNENKKDRLKILEAQLRRITTSTCLDLEDIIEKCPDNMTGADFRSLVNDAAMNAIRRHINKIQIEKTEMNCDNCPVEQVDLLLAAQNLLPSVTNEQLTGYQQIHENMKTT